MQNNVIIVKKMDNGETLGEDIPKKLQQKPESDFILVECPDCTSHQVVFSHASIEVKCSVCGRLLVETTGGKARIHGEIVKKYYG